MLPLPGPGHFNPPIIYTAYPQQGCGDAGADPSCHWVSGEVHPGQVASQVTGPTYRDKQPPTGNLESPTNLTCMGGVPGENRKTEVPQLASGQNPVAVRRQC